MDDSDYLRLLTVAAEQANAFLSNARKWERERWVCQRLLQGLNIAHRTEDFHPAGQEPPDVLFREASSKVIIAPKVDEADSVELDLKHRQAQNGWSATCIVERSKAKYR